MKNLTLAIDEATLTASREYAKRHNTTLNQLVRDLLQHTVAQDQQGGVEELLRFFREHAGNSGDWKWDREELYDRGR
jgi:hypothetical protein